MQPHVSTFQDGRIIFFRHQGCGLDKQNTHSLEREKKKARGLISGCVHTHTPVLCVIYFPLAPSEKRGLFFGAQRGVECRGRESFRPMCRTCRLLLGTRTNTLRGRGA